MGFKALPSINALPVKMVNGHLSVDFDGTIYTIDIPPLREYSFEEQCHMYVNDHVMAYMYNNDVCLVLRYNGTGTVFTRVEKILVMNFSYSYEKIPMSRRYFRGCIIAFENFVCDEVPIEVTDCYDFCILSAGRVLSTVFQKRKGVDYLTDIVAAYSDSLPLMRLKDGKLEAYESQHGITRYRIESKVNYNSSVKYLV